MPVLIDTSVLLAFAFARDANHTSASQLLQSLRDEIRLVPTPVLTELFYMTMTRVSYQHAVKILDYTRNAFQIQHLTATDIERMLAIMNEYEDAQFDFTDTAIMALAERYNISRVCTFDHRDFSIFRPTHCDYLSLLP